MDPVTTTNTRIISIFVECVSQLVTVVLDILCPMVHIMESPSTPVQEETSSHWECGGRPICFREVALLPDGKTN